MRAPTVAIECRLFTYVAIAVTVVAALATPSSADVVFSAVHVSVPVNSSYNVDFNRDGTTDFTITSKLIQAYCSGGDEYIWSLTVTSATGNSVIVDRDRIDSSYASELAAGVQVNSGQYFYPGTSMMAELYWGRCGTGAMGEWLNTPNRYLGISFRDSNGALHYGWVQLTTAAYVDQYEHLQTSTFVSGFAYETIADHSIQTGQKSDTL